MSRAKKNAAALVFGLPQTLITTVVSDLTPDQRKALTAADASQIIDICQEAAGKIGTVLEQAETRLDRSLPK